MNRIKRGLIVMVGITFVVLAWIAAIGYSYQIWEYAPYIVLGAPCIFGLAWLLGDNNESI